MGRQASTLLFWESERHKYNFYISQYVIDECSMGDVEAARRRLEFIKGMFVIPRDNNITELAEKYQVWLSIPDRAKIDCLHLATSVLSKMDYLLSWNFKHLGIETFAKLKVYNDKNSLSTPLLITPEALLETNY